MAALAGRRDAAFLKRLPWVGAIVLAGNVLRNTALVALEAGPRGLAPAWHEAIGLAMVVVVAGLAVRVMVPRPVAAKERA